MGNAARHLHVPGGGFEHVTPDVARRRQRGQRSNSSSYATTAAPGCGEVEGPASDSQPTEGWSQSPRPSPPTASGSNGVADSHIDGPSIIADAFVQASAVNPWPSSDPDGHPGDPHHYSYAMSDDGCSTAELNYIPDLHGFDLEQAGLQPAAAVCTDDLYTDAPKLSVAPQAPPISVAAPRVRPPAMPPHCAPAPQAPALGTEVGAPPDDLDELPGAVVLACGETAGRVEVDPGARASAQSPDLSPPCHDAEAVPGFSSRPVRAALQRQSWLDTQSLHAHDETLFSAQAPQRARPKNKLKTRQLPAKADLLPAPIPGGRPKKKCKKKEDESALLDKAVTLRQIEEGIN